MPLFIASYAKCSHRVHRTCASSLCVCVQCAHQALHAALTSVRLDLRLALLRTYLKEVGQLQLARAAGARAMLYCPVLWNPDHCMILGVSGQANTWRLEKHRAALAGMVVHVLMYLDMPVHNRSAPTAGTASMDMCIVGCGTVSP